jgi:2-haloacid dehalogenase
MKGLKGFVFDAYGTLFDVFSVTALCEQLFPGKGSALAQLWRVKQLQYSMMRSLMGRHRDFWRLTEDGLVYACKALGLELTADARARLLQAYLSLAAFPTSSRGWRRSSAWGCGWRSSPVARPRLLQPTTARPGVPEILPAASNGSVIVATCGTRQTRICSIWRR